MSMSTFGGKGGLSTNLGKSTTSTPVANNPYRFIRSITTNPDKKYKKILPENSSMNEVLLRAQKKGADLYDLFIKVNGFSEVDAVSSQYAEYLNQGNSMRVSEVEDVLPIPLDEFFKELDNNHPAIAKILKGNMYSASTRFANTIHEIGIDSFLKSIKIENNTILTHTSSKTKEIEGKTLTADEQIEAIVKGGEIKNVGLSTGVASQSGICMSSDVLSRSTIDALLGKLETSMVFYLVDKHNINVSRSMYSLSDQTTLVDKNESLSITPIAYNKQDGNLVILDPEKFVKKVLANLISNEVHLNATFLFKTAALIEEIGFALRDKNGKEWTSEELVHLDTLKIIKIIRDTFLTIAKDNHKIFRRLAKQVELHVARHEAIEKYCNQFKNDASVGKLIKENGLEKIVEFLSKAYETHKLEVKETNEEIQTNSFKI